MSGLTTMMDTFLASPPTDVLLFMSFRCTAIQRHTGNGGGGILHSTQSDDNGLCERLPRQDKVDAADALWEERGYIARDSSCSGCGGSSSSGVDRSNIPHPLSPRALMYMSISWRQRRLGKYAGRASYARCCSHRGHDRAKLGRGDSTSAWFAAMFAVL